MARAPPDVLRSTHGADTVEGRNDGFARLNGPVPLVTARTRAARFLQLCNAFHLPVLYLCDTLGIMVGPDAELSGTVRHASRIFIAGAKLRAPLLTIVLRKGYGSVPKRLREVRFGRRSS